jgi:hypothetical protein
MIEGMHAFMSDHGYYPPELIKSIENNTSKVTHFFMDYFGYHEARFFLNDGNCIHIYYNGKTNVIDIYKGNDLICRSIVLINSKWEWVHLCKDKITALFYIWCEDGERLRGIPFRATFPHTIGKKIKIKCVSSEVI